LVMAASFQASAMDPQAFGQTCPEFHKPEFRTYFDIITTMRMIDYHKRSQEIITRYINAVTAGATCPEAYANIQKLVKDIVNEPKQPGQDLSTRERLEGEFHIGTLGL
ncbi:MAG TPA: hypothetical protein VN132_07645, partial [Bdellovibrio sp.]|nr:hypothetical protein [Bdellovibrio sp.]